MPNRGLADTEPGAAPKASKGGLINWLDDRARLRRLVHLALDEPVPGGARFAYVFGSALLAIFLLQVLSGVALMLYYVPSVDHAHTSVAYITKVVHDGSFIRGLHVYGASAMVILVVLHLAQTLLYGSYKGRRELQWLSGLVLLILVLGMGFTGYLLPWDQKAYFATKVGTNVPSEIPLAGGAIKRLMLGGTTLGALTLSRFFVLHVLVLSGLIVLFVALHLFFLRTRGAAGPPKEDPFEPRLKTQPFYPGQMARDLLFAVLVVVAIGALAYFLPANLEPRANPADTRYLPRPDWYFRFLFQWLKYWPGKTAVIGIAIVPAILTILAVGLPFFDRGRERRPWRRPVTVGGFGIVLAGIIALTIASYRDDSRDPFVATQIARQHDEAMYFMRAPFQPDSAAHTQISPQLIAQGKALFEQHECDTCHGDGGVGGLGPPRLVGISDMYSAEQLTYVLRHPTAKMEKVGMTKSLNLDDAQLRAIIAYLESLK